MGGGSARGAARQLVKTSVRTCLGLDKAPIFYNSITRNAMPFRRNSFLKNLERTFFMNEYPIFIPSNVRYDSKLPANAKLLFGEILFLCGNKSYCWASNGYFARLYGVDKLTVSRWVSALVERGYIFLQTLDENVNTLDENIKGYRQICITPLDEIVKQNKKSNNKKSYLTRAGARKNENKKANYDLDLFEEMLKNK